MTAPATSILQNLLAALRASGAFAEVALGGEAMAAVPRACLLLDGIEELPGLEGPDRSCRLLGRIVIHSRADSDAALCVRLCDLAAQAAAAILADPTRGGLCHNLPAGLATEIGKALPARTIKRPEGEIELTFRCHYERPGGQTFPPWRIDGVDRFGPGGHPVVAESWQRVRLRRDFPGLDGELFIDLGLRSRALVQKGRLQAATVAELEAMIAAIERLNDGLTHTLSDGLGRTFALVLIDRFEQATPIRQDRLAWCDYTLRYLQLP